MIFFGPISSVFDNAAFALMWWAFGANSVAAYGPVGGQF